MSTQTATVKALCLGLICLLSTPCLAVKEAGKSINQSGIINEDYYAAGANVNIDAVVDGDVVVAGGELVVGRNISGDLLVAGGDISINGTIGDDVRAAGGEIAIDAVIGDGLIASGGELHISRATKIDGNAWLAGGDVKIAGTVNKDLSIKAGRIELSGNVRGDVELEGGEIHILESTRIGGDLVYKSAAQAFIHPDATINGQTRYKQAEWDQSSGGPGIFLGITLLIASIVLWLIFPRYTMAAAGQISARPLQALGLGLVVLIFTPLSAIVLMSIVLGIWVGLSLLALYFVIILLGLLISLFFVGDQGAKLIHKDISGTGMRILFVVFALILLGFIQLIPVIGSLLLMALILAGMGAGLLQLHLQYRLSGQG